MRRKIKCSIFAFLFQQPEYMLELYKTLHWEDQTIRTSDLRIVTYRYTLKAVQEAIWICMECGILVTFLGTPQVEVQDIMMLLYDEEYINRMHEENLIINTQAKTAEQQFPSPIYR